MAATELTPKQRKAIAALVEHGEVSAAADAAEVSRQSLYSWLKQPAFREALRMAETDAIRAISRRLVSLGGKAASTVEATMDDQTAGASTRLRAADTVIGRLLELRKIIDLEERLEDIERRLNDESGIAH